MKTTSVRIAATVIGLIVGSMIGVAAQDEDPEVQSVPYATGIAGQPRSAIDPTQRVTPDGELQIRGLQLGDIPVQLSDPRLSGRLTISSNGAGRNFPDGHARIEPRTYRIDNNGGGWSGAGERVLAFSVRQPTPLINHESMILQGEGGYAGLVAYVFIELAGATPELQAVVLQVEMAPLPDPIEVETRREITEPERPLADAVG